MILKWCSDSGSCEAQFYYCARFESPANSCHALLVSDLLASLPPAPAEVVGLADRSNSEADSKATNGMKVIEFFAGLLGIVIIVGALHVIGIAYSLNPFLFVTTGIVATLFAFSFHHPRVYAYFTLRGFKSARATLTTIVGIVSLFMFGDLTDGGRDELLSQIGVSFEAVHNRKVLMKEKDGGKHNRFYWPAPTSAERWTVRLLHFGMLASVIVLPYTTWKVTTSACKSKRDELDRAIMQWMAASGVSKFAQRIHRMIREYSGHRGGMSRILDLAPPPHRSDFGSEAEIDAALEELAPVVVWDKQTDRVWLRETEPPAAAQSGA
jgi:hypothetical protein